VRSALLALALAAAAPAAAVAGVTSCRLERGVLIAPAEVAGVTGDFIVDTGQAQSELDEDQAQEVGFSQPRFTAPVRLAGVRLPAVAVASAELDARTVFLSTPIAGVIGLDVLKGLVVDVSFAPCRLTLSPPGAAPPFPADREIEMGWRANLPVVLAAVGDGARSWPGAFVPATGLDLSLRLDDRLAGVPAAAKPQELYPGGVWRAQLDMLSFAGDSFRDVDAGLWKGVSETTEPAGMIGGPVLQHYRLRFDFPAGRLLLAKPGEPSATAAKGRRISATRCARGSDSSPRAGRKRSADRSWRRGRTACAPPSWARRPR